MDSESRVQSRIVMFALVRQSRINVIRTDGVTIKMPRRQRNRSILLYTCVAQFLCREEHFQLGEKLINLKICKYSFLSFLHDHFISFFPPNRFYIRERFRSQSYNVILSFC